jgi:hypothetical protein
MRAAAHGVRGRLRFGSPACALQIAVVMWKPVLAVACLWSSVAAADSARLSQLDPSVVSEHCAALANFRTPTLQIQLEARVSVATCVASASLDGVPRMRPDGAPAAFADAVAPALAMLDEVIAKAHDEPRAAIIAYGAKANIYAGLIVRVRNNIPPMMGATSTQLAMLEHAHDDIEQDLVPWVDRLEVSYSAIAALARVHPELGGDPVMQTAVRDSHGALDATPLIASR